MVFSGSQHQRVPAAGAVSLKKPYHTITLRFSEVVKDHATCTIMVGAVNSSNVERSNNIYC